MKSLRTSETGGHAGFGGPSSGRKDRRGFRFECLLTDQDFVHHEVTIDTGLIVIGIVEEMDAHTRRINQTIQTNRERFCRCGRGECPQDFAIHLDGKLLTAKFTRCDDGQQLLVGIPELKETVGVQSFGFQLSIRDAKPIDPSRRRISGR